MLFLSWVVSHKKLLFDQELYFSNLEKLNDSFEGILPIQDITELTDEDLVNANLHIMKYTHPNMPKEVSEMLRKHLEYDTSSIRKKHENPEWKKL